MTTPHVIYLLKGMMFQREHTNTWISAWAPDRATIEHILERRTQEAKDFITWKQAWMRENAYSSSSKLKVAKWLRALAVRVETMSDPWPTPFAHMFDTETPSFTIERIADDGSHMAWLTPRGHRAPPRLAPEAPAPTVYDGAREVLET